MSACSYFYGEDGIIRDSSYDYLKAKQTKDLKIPESLLQKNKVNYTPIPSIGKKAQNAPVGKDLRIVAPIQLLAVLDNVRVDRQAENPAIYMQEDIEFLWLTVIELLKLNEVTPAIMDRANYYIDTGWVAVDERGLGLGLEGREEIEDFRAKYSIKIKPGNLRKDIHIEVTRLRAQKMDDDTDKWVNIPSFWQDAAEMLNLILANYDQHSLQRTHTINSRTIAGFKVELATDSEGNAALVTSADKELVWEKLPSVLKAADITLSDRDRTLKTYFLSYEKKKDGFFASLDDEDIQPLALEDGNYQVTVSELGNNTAITFKNAEGTPLVPSVVAAIFPTFSRLFGENR